MYIYLYISLSEIKYKPKLEGKSSDITKNA